MKQNLIVSKPLYAIKAIALLTTMALPALAIGQGTRIPHMRKQGDATQLMVDGKPFLVLGGELHNSSGSSLSYMDPLWDKLGGMNINTALVSVSWELFEPEEGRYDYSLLDGLVNQARKNNLRLILLWFGSWKNGESSYTPSWVKKDPNRFPRIERGNGEKPEVLSPLAASNRDADAKAFAAMMRRLREIDSVKSTVIMVQVENEVGVLGDSRDRSPFANEAFAKVVPPALMEHLVARKDSLIPEFKHAWEKCGFKSAGNWPEVFGEEADEVFMAWHYATYIDGLVKRGKAEYPLPMFVNAWLIQSPDDDVATALKGFTGGQRPGQYPSGGPVSKMMDVWRAGAPGIDLLAPDIYLPNYKAVLASYTRSGNPLLIPEALRDDQLVGRAFYAFGRHDAIGFAPFGIDSLDVNHPITKGYKVLGQLSPLIAGKQGTTDIIGVLQDKNGDHGEKQVVTMGGYSVNFGFEHADHNRPGYAVLIWCAPDGFVVGGSGVTLTFTSKSHQEKYTRILSIEEGEFENGQWRAGRRINGDESLHNSKVFLSGDSPSIRRVRLYRYN